MWFVLILFAGIWSGLGTMVRRWPELLSGYNTMSERRKRFVDIRGLGRFCSRLLYACSGIALAGLPALLFVRDKIVASVCFFLSIAVLLAGWTWGWWKYDSKCCSCMKKSHKPGTESDRP